MHLYINWVSAYQVSKLTHIERQGQRDRDRETKKYGEKTK